MKRLLRLDASARREGSHSRALADHFQTRWLETNLGGEVVVRDLAETPLPHLDTATIAAFQGAPAAGSEAGVGMSDALIAELESATDVLVSSALYNFNVATPLKAWIDHVVRFGRTFVSDGNGFRGLLPGRSVCLVTARGGLPESGPDFQGPSVRAALNLIGFARIGWIALEGTNVPDGGLDERVARARAEVDAWFEAEPAADGVEWRGDFSQLDREGIDALRGEQMRAIVAGDVDAYARLCADDVLLMLQEHDVVSGRDEFVKYERRLMAATKFAAMRQIPLRIERQGDLAIECGRQEIALAPGAEQAESFRPLRKYTHVLRRTAAGWRFAVMMSNNSL